MGGAAGERRRSANSSSSWIKQYMMLKELQSPTCVVALAEPFKQAVRDLGRAGEVQRAEGYVRNVLILSKKGREDLAAIESSPEIKAEVEQLAKKVIDSGQAEINAMRQRLFPNFNSYKD